MNSEPLRGGRVASPAHLLDGSPTSFAEHLRLRGEPLTEWVLEPAWHMATPLTGLA